MFAKPFGSLATARNDSEPDCRGWSVVIEAWTLEIETAARQVRNPQSKGHCSQAALRFHKCQCSNGSLPLSSMQVSDLADALWKRMLWFMPGSGKSTAKAQLSTLRVIQSKVACSAQNYNPEAPAAVSPLRFNVQYRIQALSSRNPLVLRHSKCQFRFLNSASRSLINPLL